MRLSTIILAGASALMIKATAFAGQVQPAIIDVDLTTNFAGGDMVTTRYSRFDNTFIGCGIRKFDDGAGGATAFGFCQAEDRDGENAFCNTANAALLDAISSSADYGYITFSWNPDTGECIRIGFSNQSFYLPKGLMSNE
ncbi:MAG: hypothetical protein HKN14_06410 [Marinicaulis sp.]|nr:hypothetical protein [Marinicaulis sp.]NNL89082.1 hypothetical protein [Marinicaulis sp.]